MRCLFFFLFFVSFFSLSCCGVIASFLSASCSLRPLIQWQNEQQAQAAIKQKKERRNRTAQEIRTRTRGLLVTWSSGVCLWVIYIFRFAFGMCVRQSGLGLGSGSCVLSVDLPLILVSCLVFCVYCIALHSPVLGSTHQNVSRGTSFPHPAPAIYI